MSEKNMSEKNKIVFLEMLKEIDDLLQDDFAFDMECKLSPHAKPYTQEEAQKMSKLLGKIYGISHCICCKPCGKKYHL